LPDRKVPIYALIYTGFYAGASLQNKW